MSGAPLLLAPFWTLAGPITPAHGERISPWSLSARLDAAARAGFRGIGFEHTDLMATEAAIGFDGIRRLLDRHGFTHCEFEPLNEWWATGEQRAASDRLRADLLRAIEEIAAPASHVKCRGDVDGLNWPVEVYASELAKLAEQVDRAGARLGLEPMPHSGIATPADALTVLDTAGPTAAGLLLDVWHLVRADVTFDAISDLPAERITHVELNDAAAEPSGTLLEEAVNRRLPCGEGAIDLSKFLAAVQSTGYSGAYGVEILSERHRMLSLQEAADLAYETTAALFTREGAPSI